MRNQRSLEKLFANPDGWLQSSHLTISGDRPVGGAVRAYTFGAIDSGYAPDTAAKGSAARKGWWETDHPSGRAARSLIPADRGDEVVQGVDENMGFFAMQSAANINLSGTDFMTPLAAFGAARFAVTSQLTGCCFVWDKAGARVGHVQPTTAVNGADLRTALASRYTTFGRRGPDGGDYDIGEDVALIGVNSGGWRFFAQVHVRMTKRIQRVLEL